MNKKKIIIKSILTMLICMTIIINFNINIYANIENELKISAVSQDPIENPNAYKPNITPENEIGEMAGSLLGTINVIGVVCSIVVLIVIGIKYMLGSIEEKAEYKKTIWVYILGMFFLISATTIPNIIYNIFNDLF